jgi:hypothetical protein
MTNSQGSVMITATDGDIIVIRGVTIAQLSTDDFIL